jgi:hypothetical protein
MLVLVPVRGEKVHIPKAVLGRPLPSAGQQTVWPSFCGRRLFAHASEATGADLSKVELCKQCESAVA